MKEHCLPHKRKQKYILGGCHMGPRTVLDMEDLENVFNDAMNGFEAFMEQGHSHGHGQRKKESWNLSVPNFPPTDWKIDRDKNIYFEFALAGYVRNEIEISFQGDWMVLTITPIKKDEEKDMRYLNRGIKRSSARNKYYVPHDKYDVDNVKAFFKDGLLSVEIPSKEPEKARSVDIE